MATSQHCAGAMDLQPFVVFERSRVTRIRAAADHVTVTTRGGTVRARYVVVATGYATPAFRPLAGRFFQMSQGVI